MTEDIDRVGSDHRTDRRSSGLHRLALCDGKRITDFPIPGGWTQERVSVGPRQFELVLPTDPDAFLEDLETQAAQGKPISDPYWAQLWPCSRHLAEAILRALWTSGTKTLEVGCGAGLPGLAALSQGLDVTFSDYEPLAVSLALENARRNGFEANGLLLDWNQPQPRDDQVIIGSDVVYDAKLHASLLGLLQQTLAVDGECWIGDPGRYHAAAFVDRARSERFDVRIYDEQDRPLGKTRTDGFQRMVLRRRK